MLALDLDNHNYQKQGNPCSHNESAALDALNAPHDPVAEEKEVLNQGT